MVIDDAGQDALSENFYRFTKVKGDFFGAGTVVRHHHHT